MSSDNIDRLKLLLKQAQLKPPSSTHQPPTYHLPDLQVGVGGLVVGNVCGCIVVEKNSEVKQLVMHIICMYNERGQKENVSGQKMKAYIKDYDLKVDLSIFTYLNSFQNLKPGAYLNTIVRRTEKRNQQIFYEMCLNSQLMKFKHPHIKIGIIKDDISIPSSIMKVYEHEQTLPMNFQILYEKDFDNPGLNQSLIEGMRVEEYGSLHPISNVPSLDKLKLNIDRIRYVQEKKWAKDHFDQAIEEMKHGRNRQAIDFLAVAKEFDHENSEIYMVRGCALANMKNFVEGLKELKEAMRLDPTNEKAKQYYKQIQLQVTTRDRPTNLGGLLLKKQNSEVRSIGKNASKS